MRGPHEDAKAEFQAMCAEALQAAYPHLSTEHLATLLTACGLTIEQAFPWHNDQRLNDQRSNDHEHRHANSW